MAKLVGLNGFSGTISAGSKSRVFTNIGTNPDPQPEAFAMTGRQIANFTDADEPESVTIIEQPSVGEAAALPDGTITLDLREHDPAGEVTFRYQKSVSGVITLVDAAVDVAEAIKKAGWGDGRFYKPRTDATNRIIARPNETTRRIFIDEAEGLGWTDIAAQEGGLSYGQTIQFVRDNNSTIPLTDGGGGTFYAKYGTHPNLAMKQEFALAVYSNYYKPEEGEVAPHLLFKRGQTYNADLVNPSDGWINLRAHSNSHPMLIGAWGDSGDVTFSELPFIGRCARNIILQDVTTEQFLKWDNGASFMVLDGFTGNDIPDTLQAEANPIARQLTMRRLNITDGTEHEPRSTGGWLPNWDRGQGDRTGTSYFSSTENLLVEDGYFDMAGWRYGYHAGFVYDDNGILRPQPPTVYTHCIYAQENCNNSHFRNLIGNRAAHNGFQFRSGGIIQGLLMVENNSGLLIANGQGVRNFPDDLGMPQYAGKSSGYALGNANTWSMADDIVQTVGGFHSHWLYERPDGNGGTLPAGPNLGQHICYGISMADIYCGVKRLLVVSVEAGRPEIADLTGPDVIGPCAKYYPGYGSSTRAWSQAGAGTTTPDNGQTPDPDQYDVQFCNWDSATPDYRVDGISQAVKDATTIGEYLNQKLSLTGQTNEDFHTWMRGLAEPWTVRREINDWFRGRMGNNVTRRSTSKTMQFKKNPWGWTPGFQSYVELDWSADGLDGLPGDVAGDSVDTYGVPFMVWNHTPLNDLVDLTIRKMILEVTAGILEATGTTTLVGPSTVKPLQGSIFGINGYSGSDKLTVDAFDGMFMNKGTVAGNVDVTARANSDIALCFDDGDFTFGSGDKLTIYGGSKVGFDGTSATTRTIKFEAGSTLEFKPSMRIWARENGGSYFLPKPGKMLTGTGGDIGIVREFQSRILDDFMVIVDDIQRVPASAENLSADCLRSFDIHQGYKTDFAFTRYAYAAPEVLFSGQISEFITGINGFDEGDTYQIIEPDLPSAAVFNGPDLHLDVTAVPNGTYTLVNLDSVSGTFASVTAAGNIAKDLTVSITGTTVTVLVEDGDGTVTGGTS